MRAATEMLAGISAAINVTRSGILVKEKIAKIVV
jgi:hypothetical protein